MKCHMSCCDRLHARFLSAKFGLSSEISIRLWTHQETVTGLVFRPQAEITGRCIWEMTVAEWESGHAPYEASLSRSTPREIWLAKIPSAVFEPHCGE